MKYHSVMYLTLTKEHCLFGSLTGAVASQKVTEAHKSWFRKIFVECNGINQLDKKTDMFF